MIWLSSLVKLFWRVDYLEPLTCNTGFLNCFCNLPVWLISIYISGDIRLIVLRPRIEISNHITRLISPHNSARRRGISYLSEVRISSEEQVPVLHLYSRGDLELTFNMLHNYNFTRQIISHVPFYLAGKCKNILPIRWLFRLQVERWKHCYPDKSCIIWTGVILVGPSWTKEYICSCRGHTEMQNQEIKGPKPLTLQSVKQINEKKLVRCFC